MTALFQLSGRLGTVAYDAERSAWVPAGAAAPVPCGTAVAKVPVTLTKTVNGQSISTWFHLQAADGSGYLGPVWGSSDSDATTLFSAGFTTTPFLCTDAVTFADDQALPSSPLLLFFDAADTAPKALCSSSTAPHRVYLDPMACGTLVGGLRCPLSWQACNWYTGYCTDASLAPKPPSASQGTIPPVPTPDPKYGTLAFPNCTTRMLVTLTSTTATAATCVPEPGSPAPDAPRAARTLQLRGILWVAAAIVACIGTWLLCRSGARTAQATETWHARAMRAAVPTRMR